MGHRYCFLTLPEDDLLSDKILTHKVATILSISAASRASEICHLNLDFLFKHNDFYSFGISNLTKTCRPGRTRPDLRFNRFPDRPKICLCKVIDSYLKRTSNRRANKSQLLLSYKKPHNAIQVKTVSRWLVHAMDATGIDTAMFKAHSTRSAATSKAGTLGVPLGEIVKRGSWSTESMFKKVYCKPISESRIDF